MNKSRYIQTGVVSGHIEHWQQQEAEEATQRMPVPSELQREVDRKDAEIRMLKARLERTAIALGDTALMAVRKDEALRQANESLAATSTTVATLCELHLACRFDDLRAELERLATNYSQMKAVVTARKLH